MPELIQEIPVHVSETEFTDLHRACRMSRKTLQAFVRKAVMAAAHRVLADAHPPRRGRRPATAEDVPQGVRWDRQKGRWIVFVTAPTCDPDRDLSVFVGRYASLEEARTAVRAARDFVDGGTLTTRFSLRQEGLLTDDKMIRIWVRNAARCAVRDYRVAQAQIPPDVRDAILG